MVAHLVERMETVLVELTVCLLVANWEKYWVERMEVARVYTKAESLVQSMVAPSVPLSEMRMVEW